MVAMCVSFLGRELINAPGAQLTRVRIAPKAGRMSRWAKTCREQVQRKSVAKASLNHLVGAQ